jgi:hypothetical protein
MLLNTSVPDFNAVVADAAQMWEEFWQPPGAMVDMKAGFALDPRAFELERRTILSLYQLRAQEAGSIMPQESGLLYNSWTGKHHTEMRYWHQTWMPLWQRPELLARSDGWFIDRLANASSHAAFQGYKGARWGKMLGENNHRVLSLLYWESPNDTNPALVWHQPHIIWMSELQYLASSNPNEVLQRMKDVVLATADFLASFPVYNTVTKRYDLGPPVRSSPEGNEDPLQVYNPAYELVQFNVTLDIANTWRERLGMGRSEEYDTIRMNLAELPLTSMPDVGTVYNGNEACLPNLYTPGATNCQALSNHPGVLGALGAMPGDRYNVDTATMNNTLSEIIAHWGWGHCWGWDEPLAALTALRLGRNSDAMDLILLNASTNTYGPTGINQPGSGGRGISAYFPGNGGTLLVVAAMANLTGRVGTGFPPQWGVEVEGFGVPY